MSKLILPTTLSIALISAGLFYWNKQAVNSDTQKFTHLLSEETRLWGKADGPVQVRIEFKEQDGNQVKLIGHVRSTLSQFEVDWKLPEGVRLVDGTVSEVIQQRNETQVTHQRELTVEVTWPLEKPHLVFRAAENSSPDAFGATTVFNLDPSTRDIEKEDIIRAQMKSRHLQKLVK